MNANLTIFEGYISGNNTKLNETYNQISEKILAITSDPNISACVKANVEILDSLLFHSPTSQPPTGARKKRQNEETLTTLTSKYCFDLQSIIEENQVYTTQRKSGYERLLRKKSVQNEFKDNFKDSPNISNDFTNLFTLVQKASSTLENIETTEGEVVVIFSQLQAIRNDIFKTGCVKKSFPCGK